MTNYHLIEAKFIAPTNTRGARCRLKSHLFQQTIILQWNHSLSGSNEQARDWLEKNGYNIIGQAEGEGSYLIITDTFKPLLEQPSHFDLHLCRKR